MLARMSAAGCLQRRMPRVKHLDHPPIQGNWWLAARFDGYVYLNFSSIMASRRYRSRLRQWHPLNGFQFSRNRKDHLNSSHRQPKRILPADPSVFAPPPQPRRVASAWSTHHGAQRLLWRGSATPWALRSQCKTRTWNAAAPARFQRARELDKVETRHDHRWQRERRLCNPYHSSTLLSSSCSPNSTIACLISSVLPTASAPVIRVGRNLTTRWETPERS